MALLSVVDRQRSGTRSAPGQNPETVPSTAPNDDGGRYLIGAADVLAQDLQDPEFRAVWERLAPARAVALALVAYRVEHGLSQTALGRRVGMRQPAIARLEGAEHVPSLETLVRLSDALGIEFLVDIRPGGKRSAWVSRRAEAAPVVERVATSGGGRLLVAAG